MPAVFWDVVRGLAVGLVLCLRSPTHTSPVHLLLFAGLLVLMAIADAAARVGDRATMMVRAGDWFFAGIATLPVMVIFCCGDVLS